MSIQNIATSSTMNFNFNGVKTHVFGLQGSPFTAVPYTMDFRNLTVEEFRFTPRGAYVDNTKSANAVTLQMQPTSMQITIPAGVLWAIHWPAPKQSWVLISSNSIGSDVTNIWFVDYPIFPYKSDSSVSIAGPIAVTQSGTWNVGVNNFPATQAVSGTVAVSNLPATQPVSGTVNVGNLPATQPISGSVSVSNFPATQPVSGSVSVSNFPATQAISGTVTANQGGAPWSENITQIGGSAISLGQKVSASSIPIVVASDQSVILMSGTAVGFNAVTCSGTTIQSMFGAARSIIRSLTVVSMGPVLAAGSVLVVINDSAGTIVGSLTLPTATSTAGATQPVVLFDAQDLNIKPTNGMPLQVSLSANLTAGSFVISGSAF